MRRLLVCILLLASRLATAATTQVAFWRPYEPNKWTWALFHFDAELAPAGRIAEGATAKSIGQPAVVEAGRIGSCLALYGTEAVQIDTPVLYDASGHHSAGITIEAWLYVESLPGAEAWILHRPHVRDQTAGFTFGILPDGAIFYDVVNVKYNRGTRTRSEPGALPLGRWVHVAVASHGYPVSNRRIYVDGEAVFEAPLNWGQGIVVYGDHDTEPAPLFIGNGPEGDHGFAGRIDELRIQPNVFRFWPPPETAGWHDPHAERDLPKLRAFADLQVIAHLDFDGAPVLPEGVEVRVQHGGQTIPGIHGRATVDSVTLNGDAVLGMDRGAIEAWVSARNWDNCNGFHCGFFGANTRLDDRWPGFSLHVHNTGQIRPEGIAFGVMISKSKVAENESRYGSILRQNVIFAPDRWHHVVVQWDGPRWEFYRDGRLVAADETDQLLGLKLTDFAIHKYQPAGLSACDEMYIYNRPLTPDEAYNAWARYVKPEALRKLRPNTVGIRHLPGLHKFIVDLDHHTGPSPDRIDLRLQAPDSRTVIEHSETAPTWPHHEAVLDLPRDLEAGLYELAATFVAEGHAISTDAATRELREVSWLHSDRGRPGLMKPWTPVETDGDTVSVLLRRYDFGRGIVGSIDSRGNEVLARPVTLRGTVDGAPFVLDRPRDVDVERVDETHATARQRFRVGGLAVTVEQTVEFDGYSDVSLTFEPGGWFNKDVVVDDVVLEFPLRGEVGESFQTAKRLGQWFACLVPDKPGRVWGAFDGFFPRSGLWINPQDPTEDSREANISYGVDDANLNPQARWMTVGSLLPYFWLGSDRGGISWVCDNDRGWVPHDDVPSMELFREDDGTATVRLNLIPVATTVTAPRTIRFGWTATPVKTPWEGWRNVPKWGAFMPEHGRSTTYSPWPDADKWEYSIEHLQEWHGTRYEHIMPFTAYRATDDKTDWAEYFRHEWYPNRRGPWQPVGHSWDALFPDSLMDFTLYMFEQWIERSGAIDGVYVDMIFPVPNTDPIRGTAYELPDGRIQPGWNMSNMRDHLRRYQGFLQQLGRRQPHVIAHMTQCNMPSVLAFTDIAYEGECNYFSTGNFAKRDELGWDSMTFWRPEIIRALDDVRAMGYRYQWLHPIRDRHPDPARDRALRRAFAAIPLLVDARAPLAVPGILDADFTPFYRDPPLRTDAPDTRVGVWQVPDGWAAVVTNWAHEEQTVNLRTDPRRLTATGPVIDIETREAVGTAPVFELTVPPRDYRLIYLGPPLPEPESKEK